MEAVDTRRVTFGQSSEPKNCLCCGLQMAVQTVPKWVALFRGNMDRNLRFAPPG